MDVGLAVGGGLHTLRGKSLPCASLGKKRRVVMMMHLPMKSVRVGGDLILSRVMSLLLSVYNMFMY